MTAANFCIVLSEGLAPAPIAAELLKQLPDYAPNLINYLDECQSKRSTTDLSQAKCTALEYWEVQQAGFSASMAKHNAALALLLASKQQKMTSLDPELPFWLVELVHISPARDGAALITATDLAIEKAQSAALLLSAQDMCEGTPFRLTPWSATHWQLHLDDGLELPASFASSSLVSRTAVNDWWDQDAASSDWRRFVNEIQMLYFTHPVNTTRQQQGLPTINSLWPIGGLSPTTWRPQPPIIPNIVLHKLTEPYLRQDWGQWLLQLQSIDKEIGPLLRSKSHKANLILTNTTDYLVTAPKQPKTIWQRLLPFKSTTSWRSNWLAPS